MWFRTISRPTHSFGKALWITLLLGSALVITISCRSSRISGIYVEHGPNFANSLQLTQAEGGQITGVFSAIQLSADGKISSNEIPVTNGTRDGNQLTLTFNSGLLAKNIAGIIRGDTLRLQIVGQNGNLISSELQRSSPAEFKTFADQLKLKAQGAILGANLLGRAQAMRQAVQSAEQWISSAELHAQKISRVKNYYRNVEDKMRSLVAREHGTTNSLARTQLSVAVIQGNTTGMQLDAQVDQAWDPMIDQGRNLYHTLANAPAFCWDGAGKKFQQNGVAPETVKEWESACQVALREWTKFQPIFNHTVEQRTDLKSYQATAQSNRQVLVDEASRLQ
jgi:hypothetical protein